MKSIFLLSDTHGFIDDKFLKHIEKVDEIWHAGDIGGLELADKLKSLKPLRAVCGNIDDHKVRIEYPLHARFNFEGLEVWITHVAGYPGKYDVRVKQQLDENPPGLFICGHSHILKVMWDKKYNMMFMNPGAAGISGFHMVRTALRFQINHGKIENLEVIEVERK